MGIIGRIREQDALSARLAEALAGRGGLVLVGGEAGIGKTTLVDWLAQSASTYGALSLTGGCYDLTTTPPYGPWVELFRSYRSARDLPDLPPQLTRGHDLTDVSSQAGLFELIQSFLTDLSTARPLVLVIEDLHWADDASLDLLRYLARGVVHQRILLLATYRDDEIGRRHPLYHVIPTLIRESGATRIHISRLNRESLASLVAGRYDLPEADHERLVEHLARLSEGNPFYATELLQSLEEEQRLRRIDGAWRVVDLHQTQVPALVQQVIESRLARLDDETRRLLDVASVIGQDIVVDLWSAVTGVEDEELAGAIEQAEAARLLEQADDGARSRFTHALVREALYSAQNVLRRRPWHRRVAESLMATPQPDPDIVAYHLEQANDARLVDWLVRAGERAQGRHAWLMAAERFDQAQLLLSGDPNRETDRAWLLFRAGLLVRGFDHARSLANLEAAQQSAMALRQPALMNLARAHAGLVRCYDHDVVRGLLDLEAGVLALETLDDDDRQILQHAIAELGVDMGVQGRGTLALQLAESGWIQRARSLLEGQTDGASLDTPDAHRAAGTIYACLGQPTLAHRGFATARQMHEALSDAHAAGVDAAFEFVLVQMPYGTDRLTERRSLMNTARSHLTDVTGLVVPPGLSDAIQTVEDCVSGEWSRAVENLDRHREFSPFALTPFDVCRYTVAHHRGDTRPAWDAIHRELPQGPTTEPGDRRYIVLNDLDLLAANLALDAGDLQHGCAWLTAHDRLLEWSGAVLGRAENRLLWASYHRLAGDHDRARRHADQALACASDPRQPLALIAAHRFLGALDADARCFDDAGQHLAAALALADDCAAPFERALTLLEIARLRLGTNETRESRRLLDEVRAICEPLAAMPTLERVAELETRLPRRSHADEFPAGLTAREVDVLRLVAEGLTDAEVAERLFVSWRTVSTHLTSIYTKLGVGSRAAATRFAVENDLT